MSEKDTKAKLAPAAAADSPSQKGSPALPEQAPSLKQTLSAEDPIKENKDAEKQDIQEAIIDVDDEEAVMAVPPPPEAPQPQTGRATAPGAVAVPSPFGVRGDDDDDDDDSDYVSTNEENIAGDEEEGGVVLQGEVVDNDEYRRQALEGTIEAQVVDSETPHAKKLRKRRLVLAVLVILVVVIGSIVTAVVVSNNKNSGDGDSSSASAQDGAGAAAEDSPTVSPAPSLPPSQVPTSSPSDGPSILPSHQPSLLPSTSPSRLLFETQEAFTMDGRILDPVEGLIQSYTETSGGNFGGSVSMTPLPQGQGNGETSSNTMVVWSAFIDFQQYTNLFAVLPVESLFFLERLTIVSYICDFSTEDQQLNQCNPGWRSGTLYGIGGPIKLSATGNKLGAVFVNDPPGPSFPNSVVYHDFSQIDLTNSTVELPSDAVGVVLSNAPFRATSISLSPEGNYLSVIDLSEVAVFRTDLSDFGEDSFPYWRWSPPSTNQTDETVVTTAMSDEFVVVGTNMEDSDPDDFCSPCSVEGQYFDGAVLRVFDMEHSEFPPGGGVLNYIGVPIGQDIDLGKPASILSDGSIAMVNAGSVLAVGFSTLPESPETSTDRIDFGQVHVYELDSEQEWVLRGNPILSSTQGDGFGYSVDLSADGNVLSVGAPFGQSGSGFVYIYRFNGLDWEQLGDTLVGALGSTFGSSLSLSPSGKELAVGSPKYSSPPAGSLGLDSGLVNAYTVVSE